MKMILKKRHLEILTHYIKYPRIMLKSSPFWIIPPFLVNTSIHFSCIDEADIGAFSYACGCDTCEKGESDVPIHFARDLVNSNLLQRHTYYDYHHRGVQLWRFLPKAAIEVPVLKELMVQRALGTI